MFRLCVSPASFSWTALGSLLCKTSCDLQDPRRCHLSAEGAPRDILGGRARLLCPLSSAFAGHCPHTRPVLTLGRIPSSPREEGISYNRSITQKKYSVYNCVDQGPGRKQNPAQMVRRIRMKGLFTELEDRLKETVKDGKPPGTSLPRLEAAKKGVEVSQH